MSPFIWEVPELKNKTKSNNMEVTMNDKTLVCADCGADFVFTQGEQEFYAEKGFSNEPKRCPECRKAKKQQRRSGYNQQD